MRPQAVEATPPIGHADRDAFLRGATAEARRSSNRNMRFGQDVQEFMGYLDAVLDNWDPMSLGELLAHATFVFESKCTPEELEKIRWASRGKRPKG